MKDLTCIFYEEPYVDDTSLYEILRKKDIAEAIKNKCPKNNVSSELRTRSYISFLEMLEVTLYLIKPEVITNQILALSFIVLTEGLAHYANIFRWSPKLSKKYKKINERLILVLMAYGILIDSIEDLNYVTCKVDIRMSDNIMGNRITHFIFEDLKNELHVLREISWETAYSNCCQTLSLLEQEDIELDKDVQRLCREFKKTNFKEK